MTIGGESPRVGEGGLKSYEEKSARSRRQGYLMVPDELLGGAD